ncbi:MFS transporter [Phytomonospora endophytica]|uniref:MFS family permease n=1 Tax=Phytomonospora endophytica TaxID=714109 RepID=A0A841FSL1_9ACTN|nr:MFS transporter [Phytomonospora endophytica]MBB6039026.1 MFS family permease [Phytomonospora endophytica]GIG69504.1 MFS transporter [Phytomonospora endophytica]
MNTRRLALAQLANSIGDGAYYVTSALFFTTIVGLSPVRVGLALTVAWGIGALAGVPIGALADRRGPRGVAVLLAVGTAVAVSAFLTVRSFWPFLAVLVVYATCQSGLSAARQALLAGLVEAGERTKVRARIQATSNAGIAVGAGIGGVALSVGTESAYLAAFGMDAVAFVLAAVLLARVGAVAGTPATGARRLEVLRDRPYAALAGLNAVMLLTMPLLSVILPLWIAQRTDAPKWMVAALFVLNTGGVVLFQVRVAKGVRTLTDAGRCVRWAGIVLAASCGILALSGMWRGAWAAGLVLLAGAASQVLGEMLLAAGSWEISFGLAPEGSQGQYQGFFGTGVPVARMAGPGLLAVAVLEWGAPGWALLGAMFLAAGLATGPVARWASRKRAGEVVAAA